jgi:hypothetical protein
MEPVVAADVPSPTGEVLSPPLVPRTPPVLRLRDWLDIVLGVLAAAGTYPLALVLLWLVIMFGTMLVAVATANASAGEIFPLMAAAFVIPMYAVTAMYVGVMLASIALIVIAPTVHFVVRSIKLRCNLVWLGAFVGGATGAASSLVPALYFGAVQGDITGAVLFLLLLGPGLATIVGQIGGAWGGRRADRNRRALATAMQSVGPLDQPARDGAIQDRPLQFGISHLLWASLWLSLLLTVIRLSAIPFGLAICLLVGWLIYQSATLAIGRLIVCRVWPAWRLRRASRST